METIRLEIITAEREVLSDDVNVVVAPGIDGELGILPHHAPLLTVLDPGELRIVKDGEETFITVTGGFLEVLGDRVIILADAAERPEEIDVERAEQALKRAQEQLAGRQTDINLENALASMRRSQARLKVAYKRRRRRDIGPSS